MLRNNEIVGTMVTSHEGQRIPFVRGELELSYGIHDLVIENPGLPFEIDQVYLTIDQDGDQVCGGGDDPSIQGSVSRNAIVVHVKVSADVATIGWIGVGA